MSKIFSSPSVEALEEKCICIIGYGSQGRSQALNLRDSNVGDVIIALPPGSKSIEIATEDGFDVFSDVRAAAERADIIAFLLPDEKHADVAMYLGDVSGKTFVFAHGLSIHSGLLVCPSDVDVCLVSPKAIGPAVREKYVFGDQVPCFIGVWQDYTGQAEVIASAYAAAIGYGKCLVKTTFEEETNSDLFGEQVVLCGGVPELLRNACGVLIEAGYSPEVAFFECIYELKIIVDLIYKEGLDGMMGKISNAACYGAVVSGTRIIDSNTRDAMRGVLSRIINGEFTDEFFRNSQDMPQIRDKVMSDFANDQVVKAAKLVEPFL